MHALRRWLETPLLERPFWTQPFIVPLALVALCVDVLAKVRRVFFPYLRTRQYPFPIICVGNLAMGGTGKSPIVRTLASSFLKKGFQVAIVSRGYGATRPAMVSASTMDNLIHLNDENREHWSRLVDTRQAQSHASSFLIVCQNPDRVAALDDVWQHWKLHQNALPCVVLLDDGLQNSRTPRSTEVCVWHESSARAPAFCFPLGPYREVGFSQLARAIDFHFFSSAELCRALERRFGFSFPYERCVVVKKRHLVLRAEPVQGTTTIDLIDSSFTELLQVSVQANGVVLAAGISRPEVFFNELATELSTLQATTRAFPDHGGTVDSVLHDVALQKGGVVVITEKDFYRWCEHKTLYDTLQSRAQHWFVVRQQIELELSSGAPFVAESLIQERPKT